MKKFKKGLCLFLILTLSAFLVIGCGQKGQESTEPEQPAAGDNTPETEEKPKAALLLPGPINDAGWCAIAYEGLKLIAEKYGAEISYTEHVKTSDMEEMFSNYANQGYGVIFGHGFEFSDAAKKVAEQFPDTKFVVTSSDVSNGKNMAAINVKTIEEGFIAGATAALLTKTNVVGALGGMEIPPIVNAVAGFELGAKYINPDIKVLTGFTGSFEDAAKMKEMMTAYIQQGVDVGMADADQSGLGGIEALKAAGVTAIGINNDQSSIAPENIPLSSCQSYPFAMTYLYNEILEGRYEGKAYNMGVKEGAVYVIYNDSYDLPAEARAKIDEIVRDIADGKIDVGALKK